MHPLGLYVAITQSQREHGWVADSERASFARTDATPIAKPIAKPEPVSRIGRLVAIVRRGVVRTAGA